MAEPKDIDEVILAIQSQRPVLTKDKKGQVGNQKTKYADLVQVNDVVLKLLNDLGTIWKCRPHLEGGAFGLHYSLKHVPSGTEESGIWPLRMSENPQQMGSATTYGRRYALLAVLGIVAEDEDDDGGMAGGARYAQRAAPARRQATVATEPEQPARPTAQRAQRPTGGPPLPGEVDKMTPKQQGMMMALFTKVDMKDRGDRLQYVNEVLAEAVGLERVVASASELTKKEAGHVLDKLKAWADQTEPEGGQP
jgi:ERF superfamily